MTDAYGHSIEPGDRLFSVATDYLPHPLVCDFIGTEEREAAVGWTQRYVKLRAIGWKPEIPDFSEEPDLFVVTAARFAKSLWRRA